MSAEAWSRVSAAWESHAEGIDQTNGTATAVLLKLAAIEPGEQVLELGAGTGHFAVQLARLIGDEGKLVASDISPAMVQLIKQKLYDMPHASAEVIDAAAIPGAAEAYDVVVSRMGLMFVPEPSEAFREIRRVLRPGGRLAAAVWAGPGRNPWMTAVGMAAVMNGVLEGPLPTEPGGPFSLGGPEQLEKLARGAGFTDIQVEEAEFIRHYETASEHFNLVRVLAPPIAAAMDAATADQVEAVRRSAEELLAPYESGIGGYDVPACARVLVAS